MNTILYNWKQSVSFFRPTILFDLFYVAMRTYFKALISLVTNFWWLIIIDAFMFLAFAPAINKMMLALQSDPTVQPHVLISFVSLLHVIVSFVLSTALILLIRKQTAIPPFTYVIENSIRYLHLLIVGSFFLFLGMFILMSSGISALPSLSPHVFFCAKIIELLTLFFWLDLPSSFINIFRAFERAINVFFYRAPFFLFFVLAHVGCDVLSDRFARLTLGITHPFSLWDKAHVLLGEGSMPMPFVFKALLVGYGVALLQHFLISILFVFYDEKRREVYSESFLGS